MDQEILLILTGALKAGSIPPRTFPAKIPAPFWNKTLHLNSYFCCSCNLTDDLLIRTLTSPILILYDCLLHTSKTIRSVTTQINTSGQVTCALWLTFWWC